MGTYEKYNSTVQAPKIVVCRCYLSHCLDGRTYPSTGKCPVADFKSLGFP